MTHNEIRTKFIDFFKERGHKIVSSSSLLPDDPSVLFTTAGMQQFKPYYTGEADALKEFGSLNTASIQKSLRTNDIDEVGDDTHDTFFEMLGNFSFGGYWKKEAITWAYEFITKEMSLPISYVTVFKGSDVVPQDNESKEIWKSLGITDIREEGMDDVFWGPTGNSGPCGPTTEIYCKNAKGQDVEIWNIVFNEFICDGSREQLLKGGAKLAPLKTKGIDTGMGLERLAMISQNTANIFDTDLFRSMIEVMPETLDVRTKRIIADHARASVFLISDGVIPSNKDQGYVLRRLMRRILTYEHLNLSKGIEFEIHEVITATIKNFSEIYENLNEDIILGIFMDEAMRFKTSLDIGLKELVNIKVVNAIFAFKLYETYGLPYEIIKDLAGEKASGLTREDFDEEYKKHQEKSRAGAEKKFGGHGLLLDTGELKAADEAELKIVTRLHTATHLLQAALRKVLGNSVHQAGSDITAERTRFDFTFPRKLTKEEIHRVEQIVNEVIQEDLLVNKATLLKEEAEKTGALHFFKVKYPEMVDVYMVCDPSGGWFSKEFCGGPHVTHTGEIGEFKITKEEASSAGVRRIRAIVM